MWGACPLRVHFEDSCVTLPVNQAVKLKLRSDQYELAILDRVDKARLQEVVSILYTSYVHVLDGAETNQCVLHPPAPRGIDRLLTLTAGSRAMVYPLFLRLLLFRSKRKLPFSAITGESPA